MQNFLLGMAVALFIAFIVNAVMAGQGWKDDDTDLRDGRGKVVKRSGLMIFTDHGTGVQYVAMPLVGMAVRVDKDGKPMVAGK